MLIYEIQVARRRLKLYDPCSFWSWPVVVRMKVKIDHRSKFSNLSNWKEEVWKTSGLQRSLNPWLSRYRCDARPTELWSNTLGARSICWVQQIVEFISSRAVKYMNSTNCLKSERGASQLYCYWIIMLVTLATPISSHVKDKNSIFTARGEDMIF